MMPLVPNGLEIAPPFILRIIEDLANIRDNN
jgi:hypothetical protein